MALWGATPKGRSAELVRVLVHFRTPLILSCHCHSVLAKRLPCSSQQRAKRKSESEMGLYSSLLSHCQYLRGLVRPKFQLLKEHPLYEREYANSKIYTLTFWHSSLRPQMCPPLHAIKKERQHFSCHSRNFPHYSLSLQPLAQGSHLYFCHHRIVPPVLGCHANGTTQSSSQDVTSGFSHSVLPAPKRTWNSGPCMH